jgi:hypothetical protein
MCSIIGCRDHKRQLTRHLCYGVGTRINSGRKISRNRGGQYIRDTHKTVISTVVVWLAMSAILCWVHDDTYDKRHKYIKESSWTVEQHPYSVGVHNYQLSPRYSEPQDVFTLTSRWNQRYRPSLRQLLQKPSTRSESSLTWDLQKPTCRYATQLSSLSIWVMQRATVHLTSAKEETNFGNQVKAAY